MRQTLQNQRQRLQLIEAGIVLLFFVQALRYLVAALYSRAASATIVATVQVNNPDALPQIQALAGYVTPETVASEIQLVVYMAVLPLLAVVLGRFRVFGLLAAIMTVVGRTLMLAGVGVTAAAGAAVAVGGGLLYIVMTARHRLPVFAPSFIVAMVADQLFRAAGNTLDITWSAEFYTAQLIISGVLLLLAVVNFFNRPANRQKAITERGLITFWGGVSLGAVLFLQLTLLSTANAVVGRGGVDYPVVVPLLIAATALPLLPAVRGAARSLIGTFDVAVRGWVWLLLIFLLLVLGTRFTGAISGVGFVGAQFTVSMLWWWVLRPEAESERNVSGLWVLVGAVVFALLVTFDVFTYEYAYVRGFAPGLEVLNDVVVPLLRGFRGYGYAVILFAALLGTLPMIGAQRRIAWRSMGTTLDNVLVGALIVGAVAGGTYLASPPLILGVANPPSLRVATYNIHGGYTEFFEQNMEGIAQTIEQSGADVVLLQEVEAGRLTSFGVDQPLWLARRLGMDRRFFPTNEGLQGLAVLSKVPIVFDDGEILASIGQQTGLQRVQIQPSEGEIVTIYNTWLGLLIAGEEIETQELDQQRQIDQIIGIIGRHHPDRQLGRTVLGGTFNNVPDSDLIMSVDERGFSDPFAGSSIERSATLDRVGLSARVDYVWIYPEIAEGVGVIDTDATDHRLAFVSISLEQP